MSTLGIIHTAISVLALVCAIVSIARTGFIQPLGAAGLGYSLLTVLACTTSFPLSREGGFNAGHTIGILILLLLAVVYVFFQHPVGAVGHYTQAVLMTLTLFLSLVPAVNETLMRVPPDAPLSSGPQDPLVKQCIGVLLLLTVVGIGLQVARLRQQYKSPVRKAHNS